MDFESRIRNVTAVLGPTNTGKTHLAIERMLGHDSGMIGLPLRLLAREVYDKIAGRIGADKVALVTGEEKIKPERARYWVATVEAMPRDVDVDFLAIDEIQLASDPERGHVFTDRLLHARGNAETLLLGAQTMRDPIQDLVPGANFITRPRLSRLTYAGEKKITRLPPRSAVVAFSANEVYAIAELIRRQRGGTAVVLGALSPRTRNAQVALYQSGDVDFLVATDAIGMGLNLDVDHVAFSAIRKFDGQKFRNLTPSELAQIAGRAGRHMNDGTFGVTGSCDPLDSDLIDRIEQHTFDPVRVLQWRNRALAFKSLDRLRESLRDMPREPRLTRARMDDDVLALETVSADHDVQIFASSPAAVARLWEICQIPDYRKISAQNHAELVLTLYKYLMGRDSRIPEDWFAKQVAFADRTDGDIDTLSNRLAHIRTWTFVSNRADWLKDPAHWQERTRAIEDSLSDALHECLTQRFVDAKTSALMKGMRDKEELSAEIGEDGAIEVEGHFVGRLKGFRFSPETHADSVHGKASRHAASKVLSRELGMRTRRVAAAKTDAFKLSRSGRVLWHDEEVARLEPGQDPLKPTVTLLVDEHLSQADKEKVQDRLDKWIGEIVSERLKPLVELAKAEELTGLARGIAFQLTEALGALKRENVSEDIKSLDQPARAQLRKYGVRFGAFNIFFPLLLKPAAAELAATLWTLKHASELNLDVEAPPALPRPGLTSVATDPACPEALYRVAGFHVCGPRSVRIDILERLADLIRPLMSWRSAPDGSVPAPRGATGDGGFIATPEMMSFLGCSPEELGNVLKALGFRLERRPVKQATNASQETAEKSEAHQGDTTSGETTATTPDDPASPPLKEKTPPPTEETQPTGTGAAAGPTTSAPEESGADKSLQWEEVWRPRRFRSAHHPNRSHTRRHQRRGDQVKASDASTATPASKPSSGEAGGRADERGRRQNRKARGRKDQRQDRNRNGEMGTSRRHEQSRRNDRRSQAVHSAAPPKKANADPDSPFASLGALKEALEKRSEEKNPS